MDSILYRLRTHDPQANATETVFDYRPVPNLRDDNRGEYAGTAVIEVPDGAQGDRHRLVVRDRETHEVVLDLQTDRGRFFLPMKDLSTARAYLARLFARGETRWTALSSYWQLPLGQGRHDLSTERVVKNLISALNASDSPEVPDAILKLGAQAESQTGHVSHLARFAFQAWLSLGESSESARGVALGGLARRSASMENVSRHVRTVLDYLSLWAVMARYFKCSGSESVGYVEFVTNGDHVAALREEIQRVATELSTAYGSSMLNGMVTSIHNRTAAAALFREAQEENPEFASAHYLDHFASTYFTEEEVSEKAGEIALRRSSLTDDFEFLGEPAQFDEKGTLLLFSCNPTFFATYFPFWASAAAYLGGCGVKLHFVLVGERDEIAATVERGLVLRQATSQLRGLDPGTLADGVSFSRVSVPGYVESTTTFYACARYLLARHLVGHFGGRALILDMDMVLKASPTEFLRRIDDSSQGRLAVAMSRGMPSLIPARRFIANTFPVPVDDLGGGALRDVEDYILVGLSSPRSWTLDQNALAYAAEKVVAVHGPDALFNLDYIIRPFSQVPINKLYEEGQRRFDEGRSSASRSHIRR